MDMESIMMKPIFMAFVVSIVLTGCASSSAPNLDAHFGEAVNAAKAQQIINPDASLNTDPVAGVDGKAADGAMNRYHRSFVQPVATPNVFTIGVGSGAGGMTGGSAGSSGSSRY
jgi:PBP1b-binding outer membrane lipoprotein LpoB